MQRRVQLILFVLAHRRIVLCPVVPSEVLVNGHAFNERWLSIVALDEIGIAPVLAILGRDLLFCRIDQKALVDEWRV